MCVSIGRLLHHTYARKNIFLKQEVRTGEMGNFHVIFLVFMTRRLIFGLLRILRLQIFEKDS
jgi:hypothetical protein